jgi:zinc transport system ATP-binding protein
MIRAENLCFSYPGGAPYVLEGLELKIGAGEYVSVLGENGSGKSTLIKLMLSLLVPTRGSLTVGCSNLAYVPQQNDFADSRFPITVFEMLDSYRRLLGLREKDSVAAALESVRMGAFADRLVGALSGGQRQEVFIARSLMGNPELLVLDEPSAGIDIGTRQEIYALIKDLNRTKGMTIVSVEHNLEAALRNSTAIYHMASGKGHSCDPATYAAEYLQFGIGASIDS